jgi:DNA-binding FadR family transcriptional regulator
MFVKACLKTRKDAGEDMNTVVAESIARNQASLCRPESMPDNDSRDRPGVSRLFSFVVGDAQFILKCAGRTARALEEQFIFDGWPTGKIYGREVELAQRFGVGRPIAREAARILEVRGTARMRLGRHGGLELTTPSPERLHDLICGYCHLTGVSPDQVSLARQALDRVTASLAAENSAANPVVTFYADCLDRLSQTSSPDPAAANTVYRTRAGQIFQSLMTSVEVGQWIDGRMLGNEVELCARYQVDRGVVRQVIRLLEATEAATSLPGRGRGLVARTPGPASVGRLICCHFAAHRVGYQHSLQTFKWLGIEMAALAARRARAEDFAPLHAALAALERRTDTVLHNELSAIEEHQFALAHHPLLELFLRSAKAFPCWEMLGNLPVPQQALRDFLDSSRAAAIAISTRDPVAAAAAQERKFMLLKHHFDFDRVINFRSNSPTLSDPI